MAHTLTLTSLHTPRRGDHALFAASSCAVAFESVYTPRPIVAATSVSLPLVVTVQVSLDGGQYNAGGAAFTFRPIPTISAYVPAGGPVRGGAVVKVYGAHLGDSSTAPVECRFGATTVRGRRESVHDLPTLHPISLATLAPRPADATNATDASTCREVWRHARVP